MFINTRLISRNHLFASALMLVMLISLSGLSLAQSSVRNSNSRFSNLENRQAREENRSAPVPSGPASNAEVAAPALVPIVLMPPKPHLVLPSKKRADKELARESKKLLGIAKKLNSLRRSRNQLEALKLMRDLERQRQRYMSRLREIAKRVVPETNSSQPKSGPKTAPNETLPKPKQEKPVLPLPKLAK